jgi:NAD(P)-dependent dehydrogenase (short-subunit alcohol dehydrogenase family)
MYHLQVDKFAVIHLAQEYHTHKNGIVLISGASTGIGRHAADYLSQRGYKVYCGVRKHDDFDSILALRNKNLVPVILDVTKHKSCTSVMQIISGDIKFTNLPFVALVNNAGISRDVINEFHPLEDARLLFDTNFFGAVDLVQQALPLLRESKGRIVMISSVGALLRKSSGCLILHS